MSSTATTLMILFILFTLYSCICTGATRSTGEPRVPKPCVLNKFEQEHREGLVLEDGTRIQLILNNSLSAGRCYSYFDQMGIRRYGLCTDLCNERKCKPECPLLTRCVWYPKTTPKLVQGCQGVFPELFPKPEDPPKPPPTSKRDEAKSAENPRKTGSSDNNTKKGPQYTEKKASEKSGAPNILSYVLGVSVPVVIIFATAFFLWYLKYRLRKRLTAQRVISLDNHNPADGHGYEMEGLNEQDGHDGHDGNDAVQPLSHGNDSTAGNPAAPVINESSPREVSE